MLGSSRTQKSALVTTTTQLKIIFGGADNDKLQGGAGDDWLEGLDGSDKLYGGLGNDSLSGGNGADLLLGDQGNDTLLGGDGGDWLKGGEGNDYLDGGSGNDTLMGEEGDDTLIAFSGYDVLTGGDGKDVFRFTNNFFRAGIADQFNRKVFGQINDFEVGEDKIDFSQIDIDAEKSGRQALSFQKATSGKQYMIRDSFSGVAGELIKEVGPGRASTYIAADLNRDGVATFASRFFLTGC